MRAGFISVLGLSNLSPQALWKGLWKGDFIYLFRSLGGSRWPWMSYTGELKAMVSLGHSDSVWVHCFPSKSRAPERSAGGRHQSRQSEEAGVPGHRLRTLPDVPSLVPGTPIPPRRLPLSLAWLHLFLRTAHSQGWDTELVHSLKRRAMEKELERFTCFKKMDF